MATTLEGRTGIEPSPSGSAAGGRPVGRSVGGFIVGGLLLLGVVVLGVVFLPSITSSLGTPEADRGVLTYAVARNDLLITVTENGNIESASNVDVKCQVAGGSTILSIVPDGEPVQQGDVLVRLDTSALEEQVNSQTIAVEKALAAKIQSEGDFEAAKLTVQEFEEGTFIESLKDAEAQIRIALENLRSSENIFEYTKRMVRKGFATSLQREADQFAVERSQLELDKAETAKKVLVEFTKQKTLKDLEAKREAAAANVRSNEAAMSLENARLERLKKHLDHCVIRAPQGGMVVYANDGQNRFGGQGQPQIEEGATVREGQAIIRLPDLSHMQVKVTVHESMVDKVKPGMLARIVVGDQKFTGAVDRIANQPEQSSWFSANVKEYATIVSIHNASDNLRPGMSADVEILIAELKNVVSIPVSAVVEQDGEFSCWVQTSDARQRRPLKLGQTNDQLIEVIDGVKESDVVLRNPRAVVEEARQAAPSDKKPKDRSQFGQAAADGAATAKKRPPDSAPSGESPKPAEGGASPAPQKSSGSAEQTPREPNAGPGGAPGAAPGAGQGGPRRNLMEYDKDGDKKVSKEEAPERMREFFDRMDTNGDGYIDASEIAEMQKRFQSGAGGGRPGGGTEAPRP